MRLTIKKAPFDMKEYVKSPNGNIEEVKYRWNYAGKESVYYSLQKLLNKLGQLEDIEDELGIDLITLFKALREPVYVIVNNKIVETYCGHIGEDCDVIDFEIDGKDYKNLYDIESYSVLTKDYGKTWALTKEELE